VLTRMKQITLKSSANQTMTPLEFEKEVHVRLEEVNDSQMVNTWLSLILLDHNICGVAPTWNCNAVRNGNVQKLDEAIKKALMWIHAICENRK
jgi:hypothetical protein